VWHNAVGFDEFLGQHTLVASKDAQGEVLELPLKGKEKSGDAPAMPGKIVVSITTNQNLASI